MTVFTMSCHSEGYLGHTHLLRMCLDVHINRFGVIPEDYQQDKWRHITDLSHPSESSVNEGIPSQLCRSTYVTIDDVILSLEEIQYWQRVTSKYLPSITSAPGRPISTQDEMERSGIH